MQILSVKACRGSQGGGEACVSSLAWSFHRWGAGGPEQGGSCFRSQRTGAQSELEPELEALSLRQPWDRPPAGCFPTSPAGVPQ